MQKILFVCDNSARSQMAEGILRHYRRDEFEAFSAGISSAGLNPYAVKVMAEIGIDISKQRSKSVEEFKGQIFDFVVTCCDKAKESCSVFPGSKARIHWRFDDPAEVTGTEEEKLAAFRRVRDELKDGLSVHLR